MATKKSDGATVLHMATAARLSSYRAAKATATATYLRPGPPTTFRAMRATPDSAPEHNVQGVGIGEKIKNGRHTGVLAVKFLVRRKYDRDRIPLDEMLPERINGLPTDVVQVGTFRRLEAVPLPVIPDPQVRMRPAQPGCSIGFREPNDAFIMAGTFGLLVKRGEKRFLLSNNHVMADENRLPVGSPIFQPGLLDGGQVAIDKIATLSDFIPLDAGAPNKVDGAIAEVSKRLASRSILFIGPPNGKAKAKDDMIVHKFGRTTSYTVGRVTSVETDVKVEYETGIFSFEDQILIEGVNGVPFSDSGDSGSAILSRDSNRVVGLLFAGSPSHTIANHIDDVLTALNVTLA
ncbi:MAG TPA: hypothetical protein VF789_28200 [Thermoanaerobaculia bacterium]